MARCQSNSNCGRIRRWLAETVGNRLDMTAGWVRRHVAECPRCRGELLGNGRLRMALLLLKTQPHAPDLLMRANRHAVAAMEHTLRAMPEAEKLRHAAPRRALSERIGRYSQALTHAAACLAILMLVRMGIFSSMTRVHDEGTRVVQQYYARHLDADILDDIL